MIMLGGTLVVVVLASHAYVFKAQLAELARLRDLRAASQSAVTSRHAAASIGELQAAERDVQVLEERLYGKTPRRGPSQMVAHIIGRLDQISVRHSVSLDSVTPGNQGRILAFTEAPFDVEVQGDYFDLYAWLQDAEVELRPLVVKQFELNPLGGGAGGLKMRLRVVSYRAPETGP